MMKIYYNMIMIIKATWAVFKDDEAKIYSERWETKFFLKKKSDKIMWRERNLFPKLSTNISLVRDVKFVENVSFQDKVEHYLAVSSSRFRNKIFAEYEMFGNQ